jgi:hypothetical protein
VYNWLQLDSAAALDLSKKTIRIRRDQGLISAGAAQLEIVIALI